MFLMRFDMRAPGWGAPAPELYAAALDMAGWAESRGALAAVVCEHHGVSDGYLPSPMVLATAMAARTTTLPITVAVVVLPLYQPVRLAEDMAVLDIISRGRVNYVAAIGYVPAEYEQHGVDFHRRGRIAEESLDVLLRAKRGEPFDHEGRRIHVTPQPVTPGGPRIAWGGGSAPAAARAGRFGLDFMAQGGDPSLSEVYEGAARANGHQPGFCMIPPLDMATTVFVAEDIDRAWDELGRHILHDVTSYASINVGRHAYTASISEAQTVDELRAENRTHRIISVEEAVKTVRSGMPLQLHPLIGGLPPEVAWRYLRTVTDQVMPEVTDAT
jgi:alkanesulfonate monooxygenase SsuD/methylene tetrahydromethanopterin reductase-like flavin-dependent oxidoreductase (luciferase family)